MTDVRVRITARATIYYEKEFDMPAGDYQDYLEKIEAKSTDYAYFSALAEKYIDPREDISEEDGFEDVEIEEVGKEEE